MVYHTPEVLYSSPTEGFPLMNYLGRSFVFEISHYKWMNLQQKREEVLFGEHHD